MVPAMQMRPEHATLTHLVLCEPDNGTELVKFMFALFEYSIKCCMIPVLIAQTRYLMQILNTATMLLLNVARPPHKKVDKCIT